ncbi:MAG: hypothetical protein HKN24_15060 [Acidimicrobiales bacterium]|nr:hypothetical protein [Acidimicrobiales bacterium]
MLPDAPAMRVQLPTAGLSVLGDVRLAIRTASFTAAALAAAGASLALLVARDRWMILRRCAGWAFGTATVWLIVALSIPQVISILAPAQGVLAAAIVAVLFGAMVTPALALAGLGAALLATSWVWHVGSRRRAARLVGKPTLLGFG